VVTRTAEKDDPAQRAEFDGGGKGYRTEGGPFLCTEHRLPSGVVVRSKAVSKDYRGEPSATEYVSIILREVAERRRGSRTHGGNRSNRKKGAGVRRKQKGRDPGVSNRLGPEKKICFHSWG